jgi:hypothetical protein
MYVASRILLLAGIVAAGALVHIGLSYGLRHIVAASTAKLLAFGVTVALVMFLFGILFWYGKAPGK